MPPVQAGGQQFAGAQVEAAQVDGAADQVRALGVDLPDPAEADEDPPPSQLDHQAQGARWLAARGGQQHHVPDPPDGYPIAVQERPPLQPGREDMVVSPVD